MKIAEDIVVRVCEENDKDWDSETILEFLYSFIEDNCDLENFEAFIKEKAADDREEDDVVTGHFIRSVEED